jgi:hypothetical protein
MVPLLLAGAVAAAATATAPRLMATLPVGSVQGVAEALQVFEDLRTPDAPIVYRGATSHL